MPLSSYRVGTLIRLLKHFIKNPTYEMFNKLVENTTNKIGWCRLDQVYGNNCFNCPYSDDDKCILDDSFVIYDREKDYQSDAADIVLRSIEILGKLRADIQVRQHEKNKTCGKAYVKT